MINYQTLTEDNTANDLLALAATGKLVTVDKTTLGGSSARFGFSGEDDAAGENRSFDLDGNKIDILDGVTTIFSLDKANAFYGIGDFLTFTDPGLYMQNSGGDRILAAISGNVSATEYATLEMGNDSGDNSSFVRLKANQGVGIENQILLEKDTLFMEMATNGNSLLLDDANNLLAIFNAAGNGLILNMGAFVYDLGDIDSVNNGGNIQIDDVNNTFRIRNSGNTMGIQINGVAGFTGTVSPVNSITVNNGIITAAS